MKLLTTIGLLCAATAGSAGAAMLTYNTSGSAFTCSGCATNTGTAITVNGPMAGDVATISYTGPAPGPANVTINTPTNISYGFFTLSYVGNPADTISIPGFSFNLVVNNVTSGTSASFIGTAASGTIASGSSSVGVIWSPMTLPNGNAIFTITSPTLLPSNNSLIGQASIQGTVTSNAVPEPASMFLLGAGMIGIGFAARRKSQAK